MMLLVVMNYLQYRYNFGVCQSAYSILIIKINAQHNALSKATKTRFNIESIYYVTFRLNLRHLQTSG